MPNNGELWTGINNPSQHLLLCPVCDCSGSWRNETVSFSIRRGSIQRGWRRWETHETLFLQLLVAFHRWRRLSLPHHASLRRGSRRVWVGVWDSDRRGLESRFSSFSLALLVTATSALLGAPSQKWRKSSLLLFATTMLLYRLVAQVSSFTRFMRRGNGTLPTPILFGKLTCCFVHFLFIKTSRFSITTASKGPFPSAVCCDPTVTHHSSLMEKLT
jgi:hypothetical protein